jgi:hypothetical protein
MARANLKPGHRPRSKLFEITLEVVGPIGFPNSRGCPVPSRQAVGRSSVCPIRRVRPEQ